MNLYHLEYIAEIAKTGNISRAAEHLHISQPTLSIYLNKLERSLGLRLFERRKNELIPTEAGLKYVDACRRILGREDGHGLHGVGHLDGRQIIGQGQQEAAEREQDCAEQGEPQAQGHGLFHTCSSPARR